MSAFGDYSGTVCFCPEPSRHCPEEPIRSQGLQASHDRQHIECLKELRASNAFGNRWLSTARYRLQTAGCYTAVYAEMMRKIKARNWWSVTCFVAAVAVPAKSTAVPIPWKNCGAPTDLLVITQSQASVWPPPVAAPASAVATFDTAGNLLNLRIFLLHGVPWAFDSGPLPVTTSGGFVSLPPSFPVTVVAPPLPLAAGPYFTTRTFTDGTQSVTISSRANVGSQINAPLMTTAALSFQGNPGFTLTPGAGDVYAIHVRTAQLDGSQVFCMDLTEPFKTATPFVTVQTAQPTPTLSPVGELILVALTGGLGLFLARSRRRRRISDDPQPIASRGSR